MPPTLIGTAATFPALHCIRGHLALWSDIYTKVSSQLPILMLTQYQSPLAQTDMYFVTFGSCNPT